jgi:P4 family phage/plasmid primase-like protien
MYLLGDYAIATPTETFMRKNGDQITNDIARLRGTRFVTTTEAEQGRRLSEPLIKQITGNDRMTARFLYGEFFNFVPTFKIFMATNHKPVIKGTDHGIWRRIKLIPFTTRIPDEKQDKHLEDKLKTEASGILNWLLEGTRRWRQEGLKAPAAILNATDEYRGEMDVIGNFLKECCVQIQARRARPPERWAGLRECGGSGYRLMSHSGETLAHSDSEAWRFHRAGRCLSACGLAVRAGKLFITEYSGEVLSLTSAVGLGSLCMM